MDHETPRQTDERLARKLIDEHNQKPNLFNFDDDHAAVDEWLEQAQKTTRRIGWAVMLTAVTFHVIVIALIGIAIAWLFT